MVHIVGLSVNLKYYCISGLTYNLVYMYNLRYLGSRDGEDCGSKQA
jgi:hypothetical protein